MGKIKDEAGNKYNRLTVIGFSGLSKDNKALWKCKCDCGNEAIVSGKALRKGTTKSCGCQKSESTIKRNTTHGCTGARLYRIWQGMKSRCNDINFPAYKDYGGRGIKICEAWQNSFPNFKEWANKSGYAERLSIERKDVNGGYDPENCTWVTLPEQGINKRSTRWVTVDGVTKTMSDWARTIGIAISTIFCLEKEGKEIEDYIRWKLNHPGERYPDYGGYENEQTIR
jgi:hypothetical protein